LIYTGRPTVHFTDLVIGKGRCKNLPFEARMSPIRTFDDLLIEFKVPVSIVQVTPSMVDTMQESGYNLHKVPGTVIDMTDPEVSALFLCLDVMKERSAAPV
jgi:hypothetical protein